MSYYKIYGADNFEHANFLDESYYEKLTRLKSRKAIKFGDKPQVELVKPDWRQKAKKADFPCYGTNFIFMRDYVYDKDKTFFEQFGVLFPVYSNKGDRLYVFNCDLLKDALDEEKSEFVRFDGGIVTSIPLNRIPSDYISFTYGDSQSTLKRYGDFTLLTKDMLFKAITDHGGTLEEFLNDISNRYHYIEVQVWNDDCLRI